MFTYVSVAVKNSSKKCSKNSSKKCSKKLRPNSNSTFTMWAGSFRIWVRHLHRYNYFIQTANTPSYIIHDIHSRFICDL